MHLAISEFEFFKTNPAGIHLFSLCPAADPPEEAAAGVLIRSACITQLPFAIVPKILRREALLPLACLL
jgi:hypothetical protein